MGQASPQPRRIRHAALAIVAVAAPFGIEGLIVVANLRWYGGLSKPSFAPPPWLASLLCCCVGVAFAGGLFRVLDRPDYLPDRPGALRLARILLVLGLFWAWAFFASRHPSLGLIAAAGTVAVSALAVWRFADVDRKAALLMIPVLVAGVFAAVVELSISVKNG